MSHIAAALAKSKGKDVAPPASAPSLPGDAAKAVPSLRIGPSSTPILSKTASKIAPLPIVKPIAPAASLPPTPTVEPAPAPTTAPKSSVVIAVVSVIVVIAAVLTWMLLKKDRTFSAPATAAAGTPSVPAPDSGAKPASVQPAKIPATGTESPSPASLALAEKVRLLPVTGAAGGGSQRLSVSGKVYEPGDTVVEGLILQSIEAEEIVFRDTAGNLYTRRL